MAARIGIGSRRPHEQESTRRFSAVVAAGVLPLPIFLLLMAVIGLYVVWRGVVPLGFARVATWALSALVIAFILHYPALGRFWGSMASLEIPRPLLVVMMTGFVAVLLFAMLLLVKDLLGLLAWPVSRPTSGRLLRSPRIPMGLAAIALLLAGFGVWQAVKVPEVRRVEVTMQGLPNAFDGYRIVHLTDIHLSRLLQGPWAEAVVARSNALEPDAIMISGDLVDGPVADRAADYPPLGRLAARDGVYAVPGNHEYYSGYLEWMQVFEQLGMHMLINRHETIERDGARLVVAGVTDQQAEGFGQPVPDPVAALSGVAKDASVILLDHRPGNAPRNRALGVDLQLSGHTHGGHIIGFDRVVARFNNGFVSGLYDVDGMKLYVGNGAGLWPGFAVRIGRPSEITEITLRTGG